MSNDNLISIEIPQEQLDALDTAINTIKSTLEPYIVTLSVAERKRIPKMNEKTAPFVKKAFEYAVSHPEFTPSYMEVGELKKDVDAFDILNRIGMQLEEISVSLNDTAMQAGSEAYLAALSYYNTVKRAVKDKQASAKVLFEDLKTMFENRGRSSGPEAEE